MAIVLEANYAKKLGLPNYSSHQYSVTIRTELTDLTQVEAESTRLYGLLQDAVDREIQKVGFMPDASTYGMKSSQNGNGHPSNESANGGNGHGTPRNNDSWNCTEGQKGLILRVVHESNLDKADVERMAQELFGIGVRELDKMQASQLIEDLLEKNGAENQRAAALVPATRPVMIATVEPTEAAPSAAPSAEQIVEQLQQSVSATRLTLYLGCRLRFFFRYVAGLKKPKTAALHVGSTVHRVLKAWNKARWRHQPFALKELHEEFTKAWADDEEGPVAWEDDEAAEKTTAWKLIETYVREANPSAPPEAVEVPVEADLHEHGLPTLIGVLDLVQAGRIIDYKTSGQTPNAERVAHTSEVQTSSYCLLYRHNTGRQEQGVELHHLVKLKTPKVVITSLPPMSEAQQTRLFHLMEGYVEGLARRDFLPSPGLQCASCEFFNECRAWS